MKLQLSLACWEYPCTSPILDGRVQPEGIEFVSTKSFVANTFWRAFKFDEFDVTEMSLSSLIIAKSRGKAPWKALPIFPCRIFFHTHLLCNSSAGIEKPEDLRGKRIGLAEYQMTAAVWLRGILQDEFNVRPEDIKWHQERLENRFSINLPKGIDLSTVPAEKNIHRMLLDAQLDAILYAPPPTVTLVDRSSKEIHSDTRVRWLFRNPKEEEKRYYRETGIFPANHVLVIKEKVLEESPWAAINIYLAFVKAKELSQPRFDYTLASAPGLVWQNQALQEQSDVFGNDPFPYGIKRNVRMLNALSRYCHEQGLADRVIGLDELFAESAMEF